MATVFIRLPLTGAESLEVGVGEGLRTILVQSSDSSSVPPGSEFSLHLHVGLIHGDQHVIATLMGADRQSKPFHLGPGFARISRSSQEFFDAEIRVKADDEPEIEVLVG